MPFLQKMCSSPKRYRHKGEMGIPKLVCYAVLCMVICVNHSHQENNLSIDKIKDEQHGHGSMGHGSEEEHLGASTSKFGELL